MDSEDPQKKSKQTIGSVCRVAHSTRTIQPGMVSLSKSIPISSTKQGDVIVLTTTPSTAMATVESPASSVVQFMLAYDNMNKNTASVSTMTHRYDSSPDKAACVNSHAASVTETRQHTQ